MPVDQPVYDGEFWDDAAALVEDLVESGANEEKALDAVASFLDGLLPLDVIVPGPAGKVAELADGPIIRKGVEEIFDWLKELVKVDPEKKAARKAKRAERRAARKAKREARRAEKEA